MRHQSPFRASDLAELDDLLGTAIAVVPLEEVFDGARDPRIIGLRHDVDHDLDPALDFASWEGDRGYRSTYYLLHTAPYWKEKRKLKAAVDEFRALGHRIGIHNNALAEALRTGRDPVVVLAAATAELRAMGAEIRSTVAHGDEICGDVGFVNDEMLAQCRRPKYGDPERILKYNGHRVQITPTSLDSFGLEFDANWIGRTEYASDSGGRWSRPFEDVVDLFPLPIGQLHMLVHPCWWREAFTAEQVPATAGRKE